MRGQEEQKLLAKYRYDFKDLRILNGLRGLTGQVVIEARTPDNRHLTTVCPSNIERVEGELVNWSSNGHKAYKAAKKAAGIDE